MGQQLALTLDYGLPGAQAIETAEFVQTLPLKFNKGGSAYVQIARGEKAVIYEQRFENSIHGYEVFLIKISKEKIVFGNKVTAKERIPSDEDFGSIAWAYGDLDRAMKKFAELEGGSEYEK